MRTASPYAATDTLRPSHTYFTSLSDGADLSPTGLTRPEKACHDGRSKSVGLPEPVVESKPIFEFDISTEDPGKPVERVSPPHDNDIAAINTRIAIDRIEGTTRRAPLLTSRSDPAGLNSMTIREVSQPTDGTTMSLKQLSQTDLKKRPLSKATTVRTSSRHRLIALWLCVHPRLPIVSLPAFLPHQTKSLRTMLSLASHPTHAFLWQGELSSPPQNHL